MDTLNFIRFSAVRWLRRLTWPWAVAVGLLVFVSAIFIAVIMPAQRQLGDLHQNLALLQQQVRNKEKIAAVPATISASKQLAIFYQYFPAERSLPDWLGEIDNAAKGNNLLLNQGDYRIARDKDGKLLRYQVKLPLKGSYLNIRKFLNVVLAEIPTASLDNVKFKRQKIGDSTIEATIELTLYFGRTS